MARAGMLGIFAFLNNQRGPPLFSAKEKSRVEASHSAAARVRWSSFWAAKSFFLSQCCGLSACMMAHTLSALSSASGRERICGDNVGQLGIQNLPSSQPDKKVDVAVTGFLS